MELKDVALFAPWIGAAIAGAWGYLRLARKTSGRIDTSEATELWKESAAIREDYRERLLGADRRAADVERQLRSCESRIRDLELQLREAEKRQW